MTLQRFRLKFQNPKFACRCAQPDKNHIRTRVRAHVVRTCVRPHVPSAKILISNSLSDSHVQQRWRTSIPDARSYPGSAVRSPMMLFAPVSQPITCSTTGIYGRTWVRLYMGDGGPPPLMHERVNDSQQHSKIKPVSGQFSLHSS